MAIFDIGATTYQDDSQSQRIYAFVWDYPNGLLHVNYGDGAQWQWSPQGAPPATPVNSGPGVITYKEDAKPQRIYAFVSSGNGHLYVNYWDGVQWQWSDRGTPPGTALSNGSNPGVVTYREGAEPQRIYAFVNGNNGRLYTHYWNGTKWAWSDRGKPSNVVLGLYPGVITYQEGGKQRIYAFVKANDGNLYAHYWNGSKWNWSPQGAPTGTTVTSAPGVITYKEGAQPQRIYAFVVCADGHLHVNYWDGSQWSWSDRGTPQGTTISSLSAPAPITYKDGAQPQRIYTFVVGTNGHHYVHYWDGANWHWSDHGAPTGTTVKEGPGPAAVTYQATGQQRIYAFVKGFNDHLYMQYWNGTQWNWGDQGAP